jgi:hypothetical protein
VRVEVEDPSAAEPVTRHADVFGEDCRGLLLIATLASRWGTELHRDPGKTVWFELDVD